MTRPLFAFIALVSALGAAPAFAAPPAPQDCHSTGMTGYLDCQGVTAGNINEHSTFTFGTTAYSFGFDTGLTGGTSGTLSFSSALKGEFVLGIKAGDGYSTYLFDGGSAGITSLAWDTKGLFLNQAKKPLGLSHMAVFTPSAVPEPEVVGLALAGMGVVGFMRKRLNKRA
jgi:hypothetical protein